MAGAIRWDGCVCVSCTMRSPRSVSTTSMPIASRKGLSSISSLAIDLTLVTTGRTRPPAVPCSLTAFQHSWPMSSRASAASLAKCTCPPTASTRSANWRASSGRWSRFWRRRCLRSARPFAKSKLSKAALRRARRPVIACVSACCSLGSSRARLTRPAKWRRLSGTRARGFLNRLVERARRGHRRQAYGPDAHYRPLVVGRFHHRVRMRANRRAGQLLTAGRDLQGPAQAVERTCEDGRHESVLPGQRGHRLERPARTVEVRLRGVTDERVELDQGDRRDRILDQGLDGVAQPSQRVAASVVEIAAQACVRVAVLQVAAQVEGGVQPAASEAGLVGARGREHPPDLVAELTAHALGVREAFFRPVARVEETVEHPPTVREQRRSLAPARRVEVGDCERRIPGGVY